MNLLSNLAYVNDFVCAEHPSAYFELVLRTYLLKMNMLVYLKNELISWACILKFKICKNCECICTVIILGMILSRNPMFWKFLWGVSSLESDWSCWIFQFPLSEILMCLLSKWPVEVVIIIGVLHCFPSTWSRMLVMQGKGDPWMCYGSVD